MNDKLQFGQYKYTVPQEYIVSGSNALLNFIILLIYGALSFFLIRYLLTVTEAAYIVIMVLIFIGVVLIKGLGNGNHKILVGNRYVIIGEKVIYYNNLAGVQFGSEYYEMITKTNKRYKIEMERFPTNARKSWKIEKNRKTKFEKITTKISENITKCSPNVTIRKTF